MQGLSEAPPSTSHKMDQLDLTPDLRDDVNGVANVKLPAQLQKIAPAQEFVSVRHRWNTNEEIASILIAFDHHKEWLVLPQKIRPASGSMLLYNRKVVFYRRDGYCWKKRRNGSTIREDHMKLKVQGLECIYGSYVHSAILPTFHRRCYWLLQNPNIVLIHYLNVPYPEAAQPSIRPVSYELRSKDWSKEELVDQLRPMLSRMSEGMEHDVEEDQKVEKMLEEILLILMPMQEGSVSKPVLAKPKSLASQPFGPSPTVGELCPPVPGPSSTCSTQNWQGQQQVVQPKHILVSPSQQGIQSQAIHSIRPAVTSTSSIAGEGSNFTPNCSAGGRSVVGVNGAGGHSLVVGAGGHLLPQGLLLSNAAGSSMPRFITLGANQLVMATSSATSSTSSSACLMDASDAGSQNLIKPKTEKVVPNGMSSLAKMSIGTSGQAASSISSNPFQTLPTSTTPISSSPTELHTQGGPLPINHISRPQESQQRSQCLQQAHPSPFQQQQLPDQRDSQLMFTSQAAQNQTQCFGSSKLAGQDSFAMGTTGPAPVLTLHLKPTNSSTSDSPGFVLSLQGATIVSQHSGMPNTPSSSCIPSSVSQNNSHGGLVLVASQSPGGGLVLNKISSQPLVPPALSAQTQQGLFTAQHNTAPGAPTSCFGVCDSRGGAVEHLAGASLSSKDNGAQNFSFSVNGSANNLCSSSAPNLALDGPTCNSVVNLGQDVSLGINNNGISKSLAFCSQGGISGGSHIPQNGSPAQILPYGITSCCDNKAQLLTDFSHSSSGSKGMSQFSQSQSIDVHSNNMININQKNMLPNKTAKSVPVITSIFCHQVPSQTHPFVYSSPATTVMEESPSLTHSNHSHKLHQEHHHETGGQITNTSQQFNLQQRFETISPPTVITTKGPSSNYIFSAKHHGAPNTCAQGAAVHTMKRIGDKSHHSAQGTSSDQVLASLHQQSELDSQVGSSFEGHFSKSNSELQNSLFNLEHHQSNQLQNLHHSHRDAHDSVSDLMPGQSGLQTPVKDIMANPSSCDTLDGSFSSLPSADLNLEDILDLNDLDDVSDLGCSPFTPPDLTQHTADMDKDTNEEEEGSATDQRHRASSHHAGNLTTFSCTSTPIGHNHLLQQQQQHLHLTVPQPSSQHDATKNGQQQQSPSSPLPPGAPPRPPLCISTMSSSSIMCDKMGSGHQTSDPEINSVIKDFSPEWAYIKTNTKVLIAGPWRSETSHYSCVFSGEHIPAMLVQPGLLRCYTQYHNPGYATLQVARNGVIISNCEVFEFCDKESSNSNTCHPEWFAFDVTQLKLLLVERLDHLRRHFVSIDKLCQNSISDDLEELESGLVQQVQAMSGQQLSRVQQFPKAGQHNLTLLHLAAGLGFAKLISCLIRWRMATDCVALEFDVDAQSVDSHSCTPLTWACALGKIDAALTLYHWNAVPLKMCNKDGLLPLTIARQKGHYNLASQVEQLELAKEQEEQRRQELAASTMDLSCSPGPSTSETTPSTVSTDLGSSALPSGSCSAAGDDVGSVGSRGDAGSSSEKDGAEMKDEELVEAHVVNLSPQASASPFSVPGKPGPKLIRRFSEQVMGHQSKTLSKRNSVDLLPSGQSLDQASLPGMGSPAPSPSMVVNLMRESNSESQLLQAGGGEERSEEPVGIGNGIGSPDMSDMAFVVPPAPRLMLEEKLDEPSGYPVEDEGVVEEATQGEDTATSKMDTDEIVPPATDSPIIDVERISSDEEIDANKDGSKHQMVTLANQIIAAIPERIKLSPSKGDEVDEPLIGRGRTESHSSLPSQGSPRLSSFGDDSGISTPMTDGLAFDEYRYPELGTPSSSLSPDSTCLPSPYSPYSFTLDSPPPTTAEFTEYFNAPTTYMEKDFSQLTLSDQEQRKLYEAAKVIQNAYRHYRDKQQQKEIEAAILIQSYYRRYKTYAYYKKMSQAAVLIQNQFRTYYARRKKRGDLGAVSRRDSERLKKGRNQSVIIQQRFRSHYQRRSFEGKEGSGQASGSGDGPDSSPPPPEGRNSPCPDETLPTDADRQSRKSISTAGSSAVSRGADTDDSSSLDCRSENRKRDSLTTGKKKVAPTPSSSRAEVAGEAKQRSRSVENYKSSANRLCGDAEGREGKEKRKKEDDEDEEESDEMLNGL